jgi:hypothetical protein
MARLRDRPTPDLVVMFLAGLVGVILTTAMVGFVVLEAVGKNDDVTVLATRIAAITNTLIGAIVGYLAGRGVERGSDGDDNEPA